MCIIICVSTKWLLALKKAWNLSCKYSEMFLSGRSLCNRPQSRMGHCAQRHTQTRKLTKTHACRTTKDDPKLDHPVTLLALCWGARISEYKMVSARGFLGLCFRPSHISSDFLPLTLTINHSNQPPSLLATSCSFLKNPPTHNSKVWYQS